MILRTFYLRGLLVVLIQLFKSNCSLQLLFPIPFRDVLKIICRTINLGVSSKLVSSPTKLVSCSGSCPCVCVNAYVCVSSEDRHSWVVKKAFAIHLMRLLSMAFPRIRISLNTEELYKSNTTHISGLEETGALRNKDTL